MSLNWTNVKSLAVPVGGVSRDVKRVSIGGAVVWEKPSPLPYDAEVEYLESTGTQWIDTGVHPATGDEVQFAGLFGTSPSSVGRQFFASDGYSAVTHYCEINGSNQFGGYGGYISQTLVRGTLYVASATITSSSAKYDIDVGGTTYTATSTYAASQNWRYALVLFRINSQFNGNGVRIGACKIYVNGVLVRDYIPVRVGQVGYLYDRVSGQLFGNAGTGAFVLGPDVVPVEWLNNGVTAGSTQTINFPYIDTGVQAAADVGVEAQYEYLNMSTSSASVMVCGSFVASNSGYFGIYNYAKHNYKMWGTATKMSATINTGEILTTRLNYLSSGNYEDIRNEVQINSSTLSGSPTFSTDNIWAFAINKGSYSYYEIREVRFYAFKISKGNAIVRSFLPVRVGTDATSWEGAMMDTLTRRIYRNAGTGAFTYGADLPYPIGG